MSHIENEENVKKVQYHDDSISGGFKIFIVKASSHIRIIWMDFCEAICWHYVSKHFGLHPVPTRSMTPTRNQRENVQRANI